MNFNEPLLKVRVETCIILPVSSLCWTRWGSWETTLWVNAPLYHGLITLQIHIANQYTQPMYVFLYLCSKANVSAVIKVFFLPYKPEMHQQIITL